MAPRERTRAQAVERFAAELAALRDEAGRPSFRAMAGRSHAISHTTLHEASRGYRLPSWETTVEYVRACGADPETFRPRWEQARRRAAPARRSRSEPLPAGGPVVPEPAPAPPTPAAPPGPTVRGPQARLLVVLGAAAVALAVVVAVDAVARVVEVLPLGSAAGSAATGVVGAVGGAPGAVAALVPTTDRDPAATVDGRDSLASCAPPVPERSRTGWDDPDGRPTTRDTLPDCARVDPGSVRTKTWRLRNTGATPWRGYALRRLGGPQGRDGCQTIAEVPVPRTEPGGTVEVSVRVTMPRSPTSCFVRFALTDASGAVAAPQDDALHLWVEVA